MGFHYFWGCPRPPQPPDLETSNRLTNANQIVRVLMQKIPKPTHYWSGFSLILGCRPPQPPDLETPTRLTNANHFTSKTSCISANIFWLSPGRINSLHLKPSRCGFFQSGLRNSEVNVTNASLIIWPNELQLDSGRAEYMKTKPYWSLELHRLKIPGPLL